MANNLRKFNTYSDYEAAELVKPAVSLIVATDEVYFDQKDAPIPPTPSFSGLTVYYNITDISQSTVLFKYGGGSGSGSGSGSGGVLPSAMIIDGTEIYPNPTYNFDTVGEHIVNYSFVDNTIPEKFLYDIQNTKDIEIGNAITSIGEAAFGYCSSLTSVAIPNSVTSISNRVFTNCTSLTSVTIPNSVTSIGEAAFSNCSSLTSVAIPNSVTSISNRVFTNCTSLTSVTIPNSVTSISLGAFWGCTSLTSINIPSGVTTIDFQAFYNCTSLTSVTVNATTPPTLGGYAFDNTNDCPILVPSASLDEYKDSTSTGWSAYASRIQAIQ